MQEGTFMKVRIKDNSLRFRVTQSELASLMAGGRLEQTIYFSPAEDSRLTYALEQQSSSSSTTLRYQPHEVAIVLSTAELKAWGESIQVGIYAAADLGSNGVLDLVVEKDFACLDLSDAENKDTFPNPNAGAVC
jgi:hypothetical protein